MVKSRAISVALDGTPRSLPLGAFDTSGRGDGMNGGKLFEKDVGAAAVLWEGNQPDIFSVRAASQRSRSERVGGTALISYAGRDHCLAYPALSPRGTASLAPSCSRSSLPQCCPPRRRVNGPVENTQTPAQKTHTHSQTHTSAICQRNV